jgi:hypothetical protein
VTSHQAKQWTLCRFSLLNRAYQQHTTLTLTGTAEVMCANGYLAKLVLSTYDCRCGIELKEGSVAWLEDKADALKLIRGLMGL